MMFKDGIPLPPKLFRTNGHSHFNMVNLPISPCAEVRAAEQRTGTVAGTFKHGRDTDASILKERQRTNDGINRQIQRLLIQVN